MEKKTARRWQLQDVLHSVGEESISKSAYCDDPDGDKLLGKIDPRDPELKGKVTVLDLQNKTGLPDCLTITECMHIFLSIRKDTRGDNPPLTWSEPLTCATQFKTTLEDRQVPSEDDRRFRNVILRAQRTFQGIPATDSVKVWIEEDAGRKLYFAKCFAFFKDGNGDHFVGLRWYAKAPISPPVAVLQLPCLELAREDRSSSYSILPSECIVNGALLMPCVGKIWALQSPREEMEYANNHVLSI
jgi:hypothetical protein